MEIPTSAAGSATDLVLLRLGPPPSVDSQENSSGPAERRPELARASGAATGQAAQSL